MTDPEPAHVADELPGLLAGRVRPGAASRWRPICAPARSAKEELVSLAAAGTRHTAGHGPRRAGAPSPAVSPSPLPSSSTINKLTRSRSPGYPGGGHPRDPAGPGGLGRPAESRRSRGGHRGRSGRGRARLVHLQRPGDKPGRAAPTEGPARCPRRGHRDRGLRGPAGPGQHGRPARPGQGHYYEVWLLDPATLKMMPMGALAPSGQATFGVATGLMAGYSAVPTLTSRPTTATPSTPPASVLRGTLRSS